MLLGGLEEGLGRNWEADPGGPWIMGICGRIGTGWSNGSLWLLNALKPLPLPVAAPAAAMAGGCVGATDPKELKPCPDPPKASKELSPKPSATLAAAG